MSTTKTAKTWIITIICLLCLCLGGIFIVSVGDKAYANASEARQPMPASIEVTLSDKIVDDKDTFIAEFNYSGNLSDYYYVENGVSVINEKNDKGVILFELLANKNECNFVLYFALNGTEYQLITIYTYSIAGKVFISDSSEDTAWLMGLTYKLEQGIITEAEAEAQRREYSRKYVEETVTVEQIRGTSYAKGTLTWTDHNGVTRPLRQRSKRATAKELKQYQIP